MRPIWTGTISFGLVNIPIKLFSATEDSSLDFDMIDVRDYAHIKYKRVNEDTGKEVPYEKIAKGYMYRNKYVLLEDEDFESADAEKTKTIDILNFTDQTEVDPIYYEHPYYLEPDKGAAKAYAILRDALEKSGKVGVCTFVMRNKQALAIIKPHSKVLLLNRIRFEEEIRSVSDLKAPPIAKRKTKELDIAKQLIDAQTEHFNIKAYKDTYAAKLMKVIRAKAKTGKRLKAAKLKVVHKQSADDLMSMLKASLNKKKSA